MTTACSFSTPDGSGGFNCSHPMHVRNGSRGVCRACRENDGQKWPDMLTPLPVVIRTPVVPPAPLPHAQWPLAVKALAVMQAEGDKGVGDTVKRCLGDAGEAFQAAYKAVAGVPCGCVNRRAWMNARFPYKRLGELAGVSR